MIISSHVGFRLRSCPHQPVFDSRTCISACWFLALSHQKRLSSDMSLLRGFSQTRLLHTALASTTPAVFSFFSPDNMSRMISYDITAFDGFSVKAGSKCPNVLVSNEKALVWTSSQCGIVEKTARKRSRFDAFVNKNGDFSRFSHLCGSSLRSR